MENVPEKIYLQIGEDADVTIDNSVNDWNDLMTSAITWCADKINQNDIEYVRADIRSDENSGLHKHCVNARFDSELRDKFFKECVDSITDKIGIGSWNYNQKINIAPHDLFEWFKANVR